MRDLVLDALSYECVRDEARSVLLMPAARDRLEYVSALDTYLRSSVMIVDEPEELLVHPVRMINEIHERGQAMGDCDDVAMLGAALLCAIGIPCRFKAIFQAPDGSFRHVFTEYRIAGQWRPLDPTIRGVPVYNVGDYIIQEI